MKGMGEGLRSETLKCAVGTGQWWPEEFGVSRRFSSGGPRTRVRGEAQHGAWGGREGQQAEQGRGLCQWELGVTEGSSGKSQEMFTWLSVFSGQTRSHLLSASGTLHASLRG